MCSFLVTNVRNANLDQANHFQRLRGPDCTNVFEEHGITFVHNLLSINGPFTPQPFFSDGLACLYNGEIYNHQEFGEFPSDGQCLLPAYEALGPTFVRELDGEFAIAIVDWRSSSLFISADTFGTKPLHYSFSGPQFGVASYPSALAAIGFTSIQRLQPNQFLTISLKNNKVTMGSTVIDFSLRQHKTDFDDWTAAYAAAIGKRTRDSKEKIFIGLSSGYDSGSISCELNRQRIEYKSYSIMSNEQTDVIEQRVRCHGNYSEFELIYPSDADKIKARKNLERTVEPVNCELVSTGTSFSMPWSLHDDSAASGLAIICQKAAQDGRRIYLSGQGADEIFSDYGFAGKPIYPHSNFGGYFPDDLSSIFPWASFFGSTQCAYLMKEEYVAGSFGIEARYPFLDRQVVQEFLSLSQQLKNSKYKSVLRNLLEQYGYPCAFDQKFGFVP